MRDEYKELLKEFKCVIPDMKGELPVTLKSGKKMKVSVNTNDEFGLETLDATGLLSQFKKNWPTHKNDFIISGRHGNTRYIWHCCKSENDCGIVTLHMPSSEEELANTLMTDLAIRIKADKISQSPRDIGEA